MLARTFRELFTRDPLEPEVVRNLTISKGGNDAYHEKYVDQLQRVQDERERRLERTRMLERHITRAQAMALAQADEAAAAAKFGEAKSDAVDDGGTEGKQTEGYVTFLDSDLLRENGLVAPEGTSIVNLSVRVRVRLRYGYGNHCLLMRLPPPGPFFQIF